MTKNRNAKLAAKSDMIHDKNLSYSKAVSVRNRMIDPNKCVIRINGDMEILQFETEQSAMEFSREHTSEYTLLSDVCLKKMARSVSLFDYQEPLNNFGFIGKRTTDYPISIEVDSNNNWAQLVPNQFGLPGDSTRTVILSGVPGSGKTEMANLFIRKFLENKGRVISVNNDAALKIDGHSSSKKIDLTRVDPIQFINLGFMKKVSKYVRIDFLTEVFATVSDDSKTIAKQIVDRELESLRDLESFEDGKNFLLLPRMTYRRYDDIDDNDLEADILNFYVDQSDRSLEAHSLNIRMIDLIHNSMSDEKILLRYELGSPSLVERNDFVRLRTLVMDFYDRLNRLGSASIIESYTDISLSDKSKSTVEVKLSNQKNGKNEYIRKQSWFFNEIDLVSDPINGKYDLEQLSD